MESDFGYGPDAHACDLKGSVTKAGATRSEHQFDTPIARLPVWPNVTPQPATAAH